MSATVSYSECRSKDQEGYLVGVVDTANRLKTLKVNPGQVVAVSIQPPATPYTVTWNAPGMPDSSCGAASCPWPQIAHSRTASDGSFADPGGRATEWVEQSGDDGLVFPICDNDFSPSMDQAATLIKSRADRIREVARLVDVVALASAIAPTGRPDAQAVLSVETTIAPGAAVIELVEYSVTVPADVMPTIISHPREGAEGPGHRGPARLREAWLSAKARFVLLCRPPVAQTNRIHRISANLTRPLLLLLENANSATPSADVSLLSGGPTSKSRTASLRTSGLSCASRIVMLEPG